MKTISTIITLGFLMNFSALADPTLPAKKRIFQNKNSVFKRNPNYPWSDFDLGPQYKGPTNLSDKAKVPDEYKEMKQTEERSKEPVVQSFVK